MKTYSDLQKAFESTALRDKGIKLPGENTQKGQVLLYLFQKRGQVVTKSEAERVVWSESAGRFTAPGAFSFDGPGERVRGVGLSASADLSRYTFRRASGEIEVRE